MSNRTKKTSESLRFPSNLVNPVYLFLSDQLSKLKKQRASIAKDDPFRDTSRLTDNAAPDADAEEQFGHARVTAIKGEIDRKIIQTRRALAMIKIGKYGICENCGQMIDTDRLMISPETTLCVNCARRKEKRKK